MEDKDRLEEDKHTIDDLFHRSLKFKNSMEYIHFFRFIGKIFHYSHYNAMLVYSQNPEVQYFGTRGFWKKTFYRTVNENARPYVIIVPFGPAALAYDVRETCGELPPEEFINKGFNGELFETGGYLPEEMYYEIKKELEEYKIIVEDAPMPVNQAGITDDYSLEKIHIKISKRLSPEQKFATLIHELAHNFLGHMEQKVLTKKSVYTKGPNKGKPKIETISIPGRLVKSEDLREIEAETVSYVICCRWNLEHDAERYLSAHVTEENIKQISPELIISVADDIERYFLKRFKN